MPKDKPKKKVDGRKRTLPTEKQKKYVAELIKIKGPNGLKHGDKKKAALAAGYSEAVSNAVKGKIEGREYMIKLMDEIIPVDDSLQVLKDGLSATKTVGATRDEDTGQVTSVEVPDHLTRHKFLDTTLRIRGAYAAEKKDIQVSGHANMLDELENDDV